MKRTTIAVDERTLLELRQLAQQQGRSISSLISEALSQREALSQYVAEQYQKDPPQNPLLDLIALGESAESTDVADGGDETMLQAGIAPVSGWSLADDSAE